MGVSTERRWKQEHKAKQKNKRARDKMKEEVKGE